ncbi:MAG: hypothetical protein E7610_04670 [Ruminococcaceae bacterium]|nr:hypothetical protein [Oscillospiraceae bacterium]
MKTYVRAALALLLILAMIGTVLLLPLSGADGADNAALDSYEGTLQYTPSADGSTVTISYEVNGETVSYTVPNNDNYLFGGYAATDDLGRSLYDSSEVGSYGSTGERYVGLFYFLWHGEHGDDGIFDLQKIIDDLGVEAAGNVSCGRYGNVGAMHWFAEPLYGYYYARDGWVMRKHAELLTMANIDFLYFDVTNSYTYQDNALQLMSILHELNEQGFDAPQVVFYTNSNSKGVIQSLYDNIYSQNLYPDTWFRVGGKPVIIGPMEDNINDFFTMKQNQWPTEASKLNGWPWMDFDWPSRVFRSAYDFDGSAISVSVAQHSGSVNFSQSSLYGDYTNRGRSYFNSTGVTSNRGGKFNKTLQESYTAWQADPSVTAQGLNFQAQFDHAIESDAMYVLVTGWNEWVAQRQSTDDGSIWFVDTASMEFSRDTEMMRGGYFDNYYMQLTYNVQKLKGTAPMVVQDMRKPIDVSGDFDQWDDVTVTYTDVAGDTADRDSLGFGQTHYTNTSGRNDIVASKVTSDTKNLYFYVQTAEPISAADTASSWMQIYLNADRETTGWYGYDFIINHKAKDNSTTTVAKYNDNEFETLGEVSYRVEGNQMMIAVPQEMLGIEGYKEINVEFKIADSDTVYDEMEDFYCDGDAAPLGRLNYIFQNYIPGVSQITYPEDETTAETEATATTTEATQATTSEATGTTASTSKGCASSLSTALLLTVLPLACAAMIRRKED